MFHFSIRDVLWLTALVGLGMGWWLDHRYLADDAAMHRQSEERLGALFSRARADADREWEEFIGKEWAKLQNKPSNR